MERGWAGCREGDGWEEVERWEGGRDSPIDYQKNDSCFFALEIGSIFKVFKN